MDNTSACYIENPMSEQLRKIHAALDGEQIIHSTNLIRIQSE